MPRFKFQILTGATKEQCQSVYDGITTKDDKLTISDGKYKSTINGILADDFPELPTIDEKEAVIFKINVI